MGTIKSIFTPGAPECDLIRLKYSDFNANNLWRDGGLTVSHVHRAKGDKAEMVHVVGFDRGASDWARLSGVGEPHV